MSKTIKVVLSILGVIFGSFVLLIIVSRICAGHAIRKYDEADHAAILAACREMLANRESYTNSPNFHPYLWDKNSVSLNRDTADFGPDIPAAIRVLNPRYIVIHEDSLIIGDPPRFPPMR